MDTLACNFDSIASIPSTSCTYPTSALVDCAGNCLPSVAPSTLCWETASFDSSACTWSVSGSQPAAPSTLCWETAAFDSSACTWSVSGSQPAAPSTLCYETASFDSSACTWSVSGSQPAAPAQVNCWDVFTWNASTCGYDASGSQPTAPAGLACYESASFDTSGCTWSVSGSQPAAPFTACHEVATWDGGVACSWSVSVSTVTVPNCMGCTDSTANNYDATATYDDGSCTYTPVVTCNAPISGLSVSNIIDDRAKLNFDNMNTYDANGNQICRVDQIRLNYRALGTQSWHQKNLGSPVGNVGGCNTSNATAQMIYNLTLNTQYEWKARVWYCDGTVTGWVNGPNFTTALECNNVGNFAATPKNPTRVKFTWDDSNGAFAMMRIKLIDDGIVNPVDADWMQAGGNGVLYPTFTKNRNWLTPGTTYRAQARAFCDPNGGAYNALSWTPLVYWTQPTIRIEGGETIANLDVYPNPSRDVFNVTFTSEDVQDLEVRVINVVGETVYTEDLEQFVGEYTKSIDLVTYTKGIYFLEITTNNGVVNKKLILQ
jgi:hypothetical protein